MNQNTVFETNFKLPKQTAFYRGKVRDVYTIAEKYLVMITTDRISAFDHVLPRQIPYKGQVLNQMTVMFLEKFASQIPNWFMASPHPNVLIGERCEPFKVEMVVRGYLVGHAWRTYQAGKREVCGVSMPEGMRENQGFPKPIITPTTKASEGHDLDISREDIIKQNIVSAHDYVVLEDYALKLYALGQEYAQQRGLILADTKYEFGKTSNGKIVLMDEIHTPDSSRYFYQEGYEERLKNNEKQKQLSKEFVREWLMQNGFQGLEGQKMPNMNDDVVNNISQRYIELYENVMGSKFTPTKSNEHEIEQAIITWIEHQLG